MEKTNEILTKITDVICERLEKGVNPWVKPWKSFYKNDGKCYPSVFAYNYATKKAYNGINQVLLPNGFYLSMKQIDDKKLKLRKGSKGYLVVFFKEYERKSSQKEEESGYTDNAHRDGSITRVFNSNPTTEFYLKDGVWTTKARVLKYSYVFAISDCEDYEKLKDIDDFIEDNDGQELIWSETEVDMILKSYRERFNIKYYECLSNDAYFVPATNEIHLPKKSQFNSIEEYYSTAFHEHTHSTGLPLKRDIMNGFGSQKYSFEELVAEIGACYSMGYLGISTEHTIQNSASYLKSWATRIKGDDTLKTKVMKATTNAQKAFELIFNIA